MSKNILTIYCRNGDVQAKLFVDNSVTKEINVPFTCAELGAKIADNFSEVDCVICPGGVLKPVRKGLYEIDEDVLADLGKHGNHRYNNLLQVASEVAATKQAKAYMINPMSCDELLARNRISSNSKVGKLSRYYALEHAAALEISSRNKGEAAEDRNCIVAYIDDLVSVGAHQRGFCIDVNDMIGQEGPMGFTSSGDLPVAQIPKYVEKTGADIEQLMVTLTEQAGLLGYTGTANPSEVDTFTEESDKLAVATLIYQVAKWIGSSAMVLKGDVDEIIIAGKGAESKVIVDGIRKRTGGIAEVVVLDDVRAEEFMAKVASVAGTFAWPVQKY